MDMQIVLERKNDKAYFQAQDDTGISVSIDGSPEVGGQGLGMRPMALVLSALGSCSSIDLVTILQKQRQVLKNLRVIIDGERAKDKIPEVFIKIHLHFIIEGQVESSKLERALDLSINTYCSVAAMLRNTAEINYSYEIKEA